jgi:hypothetical protein
VGDGWFAFGEYEAMSEDVGNPCVVCGTVDRDKPMTFRKTEWCSDIHRKMAIGELPWDGKRLSSVTASEIVITKDGLKIRGENNTMTIPADGSEIQCEPRELG